MRVIELFSGIGSQRKALERLKLNVNVINISEWDITAIVAYDIIHNGKQDISMYDEFSKERLIKELSKYELSFDGKKPLKIENLKKYSEDALKRFLSAIIRTKNFSSIEKIKGSDINDNVDLITYSFPCQDLSNMGAIHGYNNGIDKHVKTRSGLLWQVDRILIEKSETKGKMPKFLLMENVPSLLSSRHKPNFELWKTQLNDLGYLNKEFLFNAKDMGIPQNRQRLLMLSVYVGKDDFLAKKSIIDNMLNELSIKKASKLENIASFLRLNYDNSKYYEEALLSQPNRTQSREDIWKQNTKIVDENGKYSLFTSTITTKQDRHPNAGNIYFKTNRNHFRYLTPRECFLLMGFDENDYESLIDNNFFTGIKDKHFFTRDKLYKLAGNSIVIEMLIQVLQNIKKIDKYVIEKLNK